jgi:predicted dinucleotide-binding enzyme
MHIGIIGAGNIGSNLARNLTARGHTVAIANSRDPETLSDLAAETGATAVRADEAARNADVVVVTVPEKRVPDLPDGLLQGAKPGAPIIDTGNYYPQQRDGRIDAIEDGTPESVWVAEQLGVPVVKAFNNIYASHLVSKARATGEPGRVALPIAGDDSTTKSAVADLINKMGFDVVDTGPLEESWRQQPGTPGYGTDLDADALKQALADASPDRAPEWRAA